MTFAKQVCQILNLIYFVHNVVITTAASFMLLHYISVVFRALGLSKTIYYFHSQNEKPESTGNRGKYIVSFHEIKCQL